MVDIENERIYDFYLRNVTRLLNKTQDEKLTQYGITSTQARLLEYINQQLKQKHSICQTDLVKLTKLKAPSVADIILRLKREGFIIQIKEAKDGRIKQLCITSKGTALIDEMAIIFKETEHQLLNGMSNSEKELLKNLLKISYKNLK